MENVKNASVLKRSSLSSETVKGIITITLSVICLLMFAFGNLFSKNQLDVGITLPFSGLTLASMAFWGG